MPEPLRVNKNALDSLAHQVAILAAGAGDHLAIRLPAFRVRADLRGLAAGRCLIRHQRGVTEVTIRFNARVLDEAWLLADALAETAPHEVAHAAIGVWARERGRRVRPHGTEWQALCRALGGSGRTTHDLPLQRARRHREYEYRLDGGDSIWLGSVRHRRLQEGRARYFHRRHPVVPGAHTGQWRYRE